MTDALDGNAAAGALADIFISEMTVARATCAKCGDTRPIGELRAYLRAPGIVLRCPTCDTAEVRIVRAEARGLARPPWCPRAPARRPRHRDVAGDWHPATGPREGARQGGRSTASDGDSMPRIQTAPQYS